MRFLLLEFSTWSGSKRIANGDWDNPLKMSLESVREHRKVFESGKRVFGTEHGLLGHLWV
jgi:hypothetical protein